MADQSIAEGTILWEPSREFKESTNIARYLKWLKERRDLAFDDYHALWEWSVTDIEDFWESIWEFFELKSSQPYSEVLSQRKMPGVRWFSGSELNYTEHVFRNMSKSRPALIFQSEIQPLMEVSWDEFYDKVASVAASLRKMGLKKGDRIVSLMPNIPETIIAFLAGAGIGTV